MKRSRLSKGSVRASNKKRLLIWKQNLKDVMDNPDYIEEQMGHINKELSRDSPDTISMRKSTRRMNEWFDEIDLANERARDKATAKSMLAHA